MAKVYATPGVYIEETSAFPNSAVPVPTAVPAFIGYTEKAERGEESLHLTPTRISSYGEYLDYFGGAPTVEFDLIPKTEKDESLDYDLQVDRATNFILHACMRLFFANGGSDCYIVSVGTYAEAAGEGVEKSALERGFEPLSKEPEPTLLVVPEAVLLPQPEKCYTLQQAMLRQCAELQDRFAILDIYEGYRPRNQGDEDVITRFREGIGNDYLQWGAAYYPWLETTIYPRDEVGLENVPDFEKQEDLKAQLEKLTASGLEDLKNGRDLKVLSKALTTISPEANAIFEAVRKALNLLPPSAAMAGLYCMVDNNIGVHQSPANASVGSVVKPAVPISGEEQDDLNVPLDGKAVNAIRTFPGKGVLVWGARTLDGNSLDWRYISVRRTAIFIEQSIKYAVEAYVFEPNTASTWANVRAMLTNFLTNVWQQGALAGATPEDAFSVDAGLGTTMTPVDVLDGILRIRVAVALTRPAEFIILTFEHQMQKA